MLPLKKISLLLTFFSLLSAASVKAQTIVPAADGTGTLITEDGQRITIDGGTLSKNGENLFHSFQEFGLSPEQIANFLANPQLQNILSRVTGGNPSVIRGLIEVTGGSPNLYLMNPAGIIFGESARLNVPADFTATTATGIGFENGWFNAFGDNNYSDLVGTPNQFIFNTDNPSAIINAGDLALSTGNNLSLIGGSVANTGTLTSQDGNITITAVPGENLIRISQKGHILSLEIVPPDTRIGEWNLSVYDLPTLLTGNNIPETGLALAEDSKTVTLNETVIPTTAGSSSIAGQLNVSGETGGNIYVLGDNIGLYQAQVSADGINGAGDIFIGGEYQGEGAFNAQRTFVSEGSQLSANALNSGDGGQVIVWSDEKTAFFGEISAQGGTLSGNGGFVEISGKQALAFNGYVDVSAPQGAAGTILFDPRDIIIESAESSADDSELSDGEILLTDGGTDTDFIISDQALTSLDGDIILQADRDINADSNVTSLDFINQTSGESITFTAGRNINLSNTDISTDGGDVNLTANTGSVAVQGLESIAPDSVNTSFAGSIEINAGENINIDTLDVSTDTGTSGLVTLNAATDITLGQITLGAGEGTSQPININTPETVTVTAQPDINGADINIGNEDTRAINFVVNNTINTEGGDFNLFLSSNETIEVGLFTAGGNVTVDSLDSLNLNSVVDTDGGNITINAANISSSNLVDTPLDSSNFTGDGGDVTVATEGDINLGNIDAFAGVEGGEGGETFGNGGNIAIESTQGNITLGSLDSSPSFGSSGDGGNVSINALQGDVNINQVVTGEFGGVSGSSGNMGDIDISAFGEVETSFLSTYSAGFGQGGDVTLESENSNVSVSVIDSGSSDGDGGAVNVTAGNEIIVDSLIYTGSGSLANPSFSISTGAGTGGSINLNSNGSIAIAELNSSSREGDGGAITLNSANNITLTDRVRSTSENGNGGAIALQAGGFIDATLADEQTIEDVDNEVNGLDDLEEYTISASAGGNAGNITLEAGEEITVGFIAAAAENGTGGDITLNSTEGNINALYSLSEETAIGIIINGSELGDGGDVNISAFGDVRTGLIGSASLDNDAGGSITLTSETGSIDTTSNLGSLDPSFWENLGFNPVLTQAIIGTPGNLGLLFSGSNEGTGGNVELTAQGDIATGMIITGTLGEEGGNVTLTSNNGSVNTPFDAIVDGVTEDFLIEAGVDPDLAALLDGVSVRLGIITFSEEAQGGNVTINANGDIITSNITTGSLRGDGGNITLNSETGNIDGSVGRFLENVSPELLAEIDLDSDVDLIAEYFSEQAIGGYVTLSIDQNAGDVNLSAAGDITTNYLISSSFSGEGGSITLDTDNGSINIGSVIFDAAQGIFPGTLGTENEDLEIIADLVSGGNVNASGAIGGDIQIGDAIEETPENSIEETPENGTEETLENATGEITAGAINSSGRIGNGGEITLTSEQDIEVTSLNSQAGEGGIGGAIDVTTEEFFRATGTFLDQNETLASISSIGGEGGNEITIRHGGRGEIPFVVGNAEVNGTAGTITSGEFEIDQGSFLFTEIEGNISIISLSPDLDPSTFEQESPTQFSAVNQSSPGLVTQTQAQETLQSIDRATGIKPALIYVNFVPQTLTGVANFERQEALSTQDYEQYFDLPQRKADFNLSVPRQSDDQLEILLVTEEGEPFRITVEGVTREDVIQTAEELYSLISSPPSPFASANPLYLEPAQQLYNWLIEPLEATLAEQEVENLVFIMPSGLRLLPVAALHDGEQFLVEKYSSGFSPSLSLTDTRYKNIQDLEVLAAGASNFSDPTAIGPLPAVSVELPTIANEIWRGEFSLNEDFTLENFRQQRQRDPKGIIHLATHADFRSGNPEDIYIQFYDQKVSLDEIRQLDLNDPPLELLVLSACRTAVGDEQVELGFAGLTVQAGVKSAMASLWYVGDTGTVALMSEFYRQLNTAPIKAEAIRKAQISLITGDVRIEGGEIITPRGGLSLPSDVPIRPEDLSHPYYWAAFTMVGSPW